MNFPPAPVPTIIYFFPNNAELEQGGLIYKKSGERGVSTSESGEELQPPFPVGTVAHNTTTNAIYVSNPHGWLLASYQGPAYYDVPQKIKVVRYDIYGPHNYRGDREEILYSLPLDLVIYNWLQVVDGDAPAFTGAIKNKQKVSIRYQFKEWPNPKDEQINFQREGAPITRGELASLIAHQMKKLIMDKHDHAPLMFDFGHGQTKEVMLSDLVLVSVKHASKSSIQAILGVITYEL